MKNYSNQTPIFKDIVLVGGGHSHVGVVKEIAMRNPAGVRVTLICSDTDTPYSGMLPGYIAGHYGFDEVHIDLRRLCAVTGARFIKAKVTHIDHSNQQVICQERPPIPYDVLSINIGSTPQITTITGASEHAIPVKPIAQFNRYWLQLLEQVQQREKSLKIAVVGGGVGGVELLLAMQHRFQQEQRLSQHDQAHVTFTLLTHHELLPNQPAKVRQFFNRLLQKRQVQIRTHCPIVSVSANTLHTANGETITADAIIWVTQAGAAEWLKKTELSLNDQGFIQVKNTLQTVSHDCIFAAGDIVDFIDRPLEKAGVFAVKMAKPLATNLLRVLQNQPLMTYTPQKSWLALISTGDQYAVASKGSMACWGNWVWRWKNWIDQRFMRQFNQTDELFKRIPKLNPLQITLDDHENTQAMSELAMRYNSDNPKLSHDALHQALTHLKVIQHKDILIDLSLPSNAAIFRIPPGKVLIHTLDFLRAMIDDPYLFGKIAAHHALNNLFAIGAQAQTATTIVTLPPGLERKTEQFVSMLVQGAVEVLNQTHCALVGGHTSEGQELSLGFSINGLTPENLKLTMTQKGLKPGDAIILTKPIGTGVLFTALTQGKAKGRWIDSALNNMQISNYQAARIFQQFGCVTCTNLSNFGLLGHLVEMSKISDVQTKIIISNIPYLMGALECVQAGVISFSQECKTRLSQAIHNQAEWENDPRYALLFDPQTAGGLIAAIPKAVAKQCVEELQENNYRHAQIIGWVDENAEHLKSILLI